jgi:hypothetical protein
MRRIVPRTQRFASTNEPIAFSKSKAAQTNLDEAMEFTPAGTSQTTIILAVVGTAILGGVIYTFFTTDNSNGEQFFPANSLETNPNIGSPPLPPVTSSKEQQ